MANIKAKDISGVRVLTPPVRFLSSRSKSSGGGGTGSKSGGGGGTGSGSSGGGGTGSKSGGGSGTGSGSSAPTYTFADFLNAARAQATPQLVELEPFDRNAEQASVSGMLRPRYELAIADRERRTDAAGAELDADALSRNMGTSAYVTDVKGRMQEQEARDIATLEAQFSAEVEKYLIETEQSYNERRTETDLFNAGEWNDAMNLAYDRAMALYDNYLAAVKSGGGGRKKAAASEPDLSKVFDGQSWAWDRIASVDQEAVYDYLQNVCTPEERDQIYYGNSPLYDTVRVEILKSLGTSGTRAAHWNIPGNETYPSGYTVYP